MAAAIRIGGIEPFEESQGADDRVASPDVLNAFYLKMQHDDALNRKLSRGQSKRSFFSRKQTTKKPTRAPPALEKLSTPMDADSILDTKGEDDVDKWDNQEEKKDELARSLSHSIIPGALRELPAWFIKENELAMGQTHSYRIRYPIHNPSGPQWYKNQHLIPVSQRAAATRPPSVFSPSFPPMAASLHEQMEEPPTRPGLSQSPAGSPVDTPNSSQADVATKPRTRKTSQTTPDTVDLLDVTDPWGSHYHHQSPYDPGLTTTSSASPVNSIDIPEPPTSPRSRRSSMTAGMIRRRTVTPSPLSQSTSAIHLQPPDAGHPVRRKLSKRRKVMNGIFGGGEDANLQQVASDLELRSLSAPVTPIESPAPAFSKRSSTVPSGLHLGHDLHKRTSTLPTLMSHPSYGSTTSVPTLLMGSKKEKRGSVLGRLAKKLSIMKRPTQEVDDWQHIGVNDTQSPRSSRQSIVVPRPSLQEKLSMESRKTDPIRRVPPPAVETEVSEGIIDHALPRPSLDRRSSIEMDSSYRMGKLTIANPDSPSSADNTPTKSTIALPAESEPFPQVIQRPRASTIDPLERPKSTLPPLPDATPRDMSSQATLTPMMSPLSQPAPIADTVSSVYQSLPEMPMSPAMTDPMTLYPMYMTNLPNLSALRFSGGDPRPTSAISVSARATIASSPVSFLDDSPLSRSSMIVNPPTPHTSSTAMTPPLLPISAPLPLAVKSKVVAEPLPYIPASSKVFLSSKSKAEPLRPKVEVAKPAVEVETKDDAQRGASPVKSRQTETFKLIRSASGNVIMASETISAAGQHWEVVGSDPAKKSKTKERSSRSRDRERSKDQDTGARRDSRRQETSGSSEAPAEQRPHSSRQRSSHIKMVDPPVLPSKPVRAHSIDIPQGSSQEPARQGRKETHLNFDKPQPPPPPPTPGPSRLERQPSASARPTSELPSSAELSGLRAREAWDMDRLWKGRSLYAAPQPDTGAVPTSTPTRESKVTSVTTDISRDNISTRSTGHGSSYTNFMVQSLQPRIPANMYYSNMPSAPPPTIYSPTSTQQSTYSPSASYDYMNYRSMPPSFILPLSEQIPDPPPRSNPLPPPPRESAYQPSPLRPLSGSSRPSSDHWTKHPGVTTAH